MYRLKGEERLSELEDQQVLLKDLRAALASKDIDEYLKFIKKHGLNESQRIKLDYAEDLKFMVAEIAKSILGGYSRTEKTKDKEIFVITKHRNYDVRTAFELGKGQFTGAIFNINLGKMTFEIDYDALNEVIFKVVMKHYVERASFEFMGGHKKEPFFTAESYLDEVYFLDEPMEIDAAIKKKILILRKAEKDLYDFFGAVTLDEAVRNISDEVESIKQYLESNFGLKNNSDRLTKKTTFAFMTSVPWKEPVPAIKKRGLFGKKVESRNVLDVSYDEVNTHHSPSIDGPHFIRAMLYFIRKDDERAESFYERRMTVTDRRHLKYIASTGVSFDDPELREDLIGSTISVQSVRDEVSLKVDGIKVIILPNGIVKIYNKLDSESYLERQGILKVMANPNFRLFLRTVAYNTFEVIDSEKKIYSYIKLNPNHSFE